MMNSKLAIQRDQYTGLSTKLSLDLVNLAGRITPSSDLGRGYGDEDSAISVMEEIPSMELFEELGGKNFVGKKALQHGFENSPWSNGLDSYIQTETVLGANSLFIGAGFSIAEFQNASTTDYFKPEQVFN